MTSAMSRQYMVNHQMNCEDNCYRTVPTKSQTNWVSFCSNFSLTMEMGTCYLIHLGLGFISKMKVKD